MISLIKSATSSNISKILARSLKYQCFTRCISSSQNNVFLKSGYNTPYLNNALSYQEQSGLRLCHHDSKTNLHLSDVTLQTLHYVPATTQDYVSKDEKREFMAVFPDIVRELTDHAKKYDSTVAAKWYAKALQYNVPLGKKNRGLATVMAYKMLAKPDMMTPENLRLVYYLGWCIEMVQSMFLISDDIMDDSPMRRGQPAWHTIENVNMTAINDALMIENGIYYILNKKFSHLPCYTKMVQLFHEGVFITTIGQSLDQQSAIMDVTKFTMDIYKAIVKNKTSYYTFYLPVALAMHMTNINDPELHRQAKTILLEIGQFFQTQDDFLDCFGDPNATGKIGTDIEDGKCTWLAVVFMQRASEQQKQRMKECYKSKDPENVIRIKKLYKEVGLPMTYAIYEEESYNMIRTHIQQVSRGLPHDLFFKIMDKIYRRDS